MLKIARFLISAAVIFGAAYLLSEKATWGFNITRLHTTRDLGFQNQGTDPGPYLKQRFLLQKQGGQSFVFFSEDGKYALKFFKDMPRPWLAKSSYQQKKWGKLKRTLNGYQLAYDNLAEETALLYLHLKPNKSSLEVRLVDRLNIEHTVDLSSVYFVLQKRVEPLTFTQFQTHIHAIKRLIEKRDAAHIADHDPRLLANIGWNEGQPVFIDPGRFVHE